MSAALKVSNLENESHEKLLVNAINAPEGRQNFPSFNITGKKRVTAKDFDRLSPQQFKELVQFIFNGYTTSKLNAALSNEEGSKRLMNFTNLLPSARVQFDSRPAALYQAIKDVFPEGSDLLQPSVVNNPAGDPQRTRKVLKYLCSLLLFVDSCGEEFNAVQEDVIAQVNEKRAIKDQLDATKTDINKRLLDLDTWKNEVPLLEKQSLQKKEEIEAISHQTAAIEEQVKEAEKVYSALMEKNKNTARAVDQTKKEIEKMRNMLVTNVESIVQEYNTENATLQELARKREMIGREIDEAKKESDTVNEVTEDASHCISELKDIIHFMEELLEVQANVEQAKYTKEQKEETIKEMEKSLKQMQDQCTGLVPAEAREQYNTEVQKLESCKREVQSYRVRAENLTKQLTEVVARISNERNVRPAKQAQLSQLQERVRVDERYISEEVPAIVARLHQMVQDTLADLKDEFASIKLA